MIDCEDRRIVAAPPRCKFVALSYVWGEQAAQYDSNNGFMTWEQMPLLIQQSMQITRDLGYRYLWIDRYVCPAYSTQILIID